MILSEPGDEARGVEQLRALIARADIVVESARPRALAQLGIDAAEIVRNQEWLGDRGRDPARNAAESLRAEKDVPASASRVSRLE